jgi:hypothetical protein
VIQPGGRSGGEADPESLLAFGREVLDPVLEAAGFRFLAGDAGRGSGGHYTRADYTRGSRRLELHYRRSLGLVRYHVGHVSLAHREYVDAVAGSRAPREYPGFSDDPRDGFRHLRADLERYGSAFLEGSDEDFRRLVESSAMSRRGGISRLNHIEQSNPDTAERSEES